MWFTVWMLIVMLAGIPLSTRTQEQEETTEEQFLEEDGEITDEEYADEFEQAYDEDEIFEEDELFPEEDEESIDYIAADEPEEPDAVSDQIMPEATSVPTPSAAPVSISIPPMATTPVTTPSSTPTASTSTTTPTTTPPAPSSGSTPTTPASVGSPVSTSTTAPTTPTSSITPAPTTSAASSGSTPTTPSNTTAPTAPTTSAPSPTSTPATPSTADASSSATSTPTTSPVSTTSASTTSATTASSSITPASSSTTAPTTHAAAATSSPTAPTSTVTPTAPLVSSAPHIPAATSMPTASQPPKKTAPSTVPKGFDTVDVSEPSGNWLYKRVWWEQAQTRYGKIQEEMDKIFESRMTFLTKQDDAEQKVFEPLMMNIGFSQGELSVVLTDLLHEIERVKEKQGGTLTPEQKDFLEKISIHQKNLEQLKQDVQAITTVERGLEEDINQLEKQIMKARSLEKEAWNNFQTIGKELSDVKARQLYYAIETLEKSIDDILVYITTTMNAHFDQLLKVAQEQANRVSSTVQALKEKGIDFKKHAQEMEKQAAGKQKDARENDMQEVADTQQESGWMNRISDAWQYIKNGIVAIWDTTMNALSSAYQMISGWFVSADPESQEQDQQSLSPAISADQQEEAGQPDAMPASLPESLESVESTENDEEVAEQPGVNTMDSPVKPAVPTRMPLAPVSQTTTASENAPREQPQAVKKSILSSVSSGEASAQSKAGAPD